MKSISSAGYSYMSISRQNAAVLSEMISAKVMTTMRVTRYLVRLVSARAGAKSESAMLKKNRFGSMFLSRSRDEEVTNTKSQCDVGCRMRDPGSDCPAIRSETRPPRPKDETNEIGFMLARLLFPQLVNSFAQPGCIRAIIRAELGGVMAEGYRGRS